jgi:hypothetical protein
MNAELLTRTDLALLSRLTTVPTDTAHLPPAVLFPDRAPSEHAVPTRLGALAKDGFVLKGDTGGPVKTRRVVWSITPLGQTVLDNYRKVHHHT